MRRSVRSAPSSGATSRSRARPPRRSSGELDEAAVEAAAADVRVPGRLQIVDQHPLTLLDGAHNPDGIAALTESLPEIIASARRGDGRVVAVVSILDDKDAVGDAALARAAVRCAGADLEPQPARAAAADAELAA